MFATFSVSSAAAGEWVVALAPRSDATLGGATDPSGVVGQSERLIQVLQQLSSAGQIALVALGGAGHAARLAAVRQVKILVAPFLEAVIID